MKKKSAKKPAPAAKPVVIDAKALQAALNSIDDANVGRMAFHLENVRKTTGSILDEDIQYCFSLSKRMRDKAIADLQKQQS